MSIWWTRIGPLKKQAEEARTQRDVSMGRLIEAIKNNTNSKRDLTTQINSLVDLIQDHNN